MSEPASVPNYLGQILELYARGAFEPGSIVHINVAHDDGCAIFAVGVCDCQPDVRVLERPPAGWEPR